jgi:hypothetical protein
MKKNNKKYIFLIGIIFGLCIFLLPSVSKAACPLGCGCGAPSGQTPVCCWATGGSAERLGIMEGVNECPMFYFQFSAACQNCGGYGCKENGFIGGANGAGCTALDQDFGIISCGTVCSKSGKWDASEGQCIQCNGKIESNYLGSSSEIYNNPCVTPPAGDGQCESACRADSQCDEKSSGSSVSVSGGVCNNCVFTACECSSMIDGGCCDGCNYCPAGKVFSTTYWSCIDATATTKCASTVNKCTAGQCSGEMRYPECNGAGSCDSTATTYYQSTSVYASANKVLTSTCTNQDATSSVECASTVNKCTAGECSGEKRYPECNGAGSCDSTATSYYQSSGTIYASANKVLTSTCTNQDATSSVKCDSTVNKCTAGECSGEKRYPECDSSGNCDSSATSYYQSATVSASAGYSLTSTCGTTGSTLCDSTWRASSGTGDSNYGAGGSYNCQGMCNGGSCLYAANCQGVCSGTQTVLISGSGTCTVTASLSATGCDGQSWQIKDGGTTKCSGTVSGNPYSYTCPDWTVGTGAYTYDLYIDGVSKDSDPATCPGTSEFDFSISSVSPASGSVTQGGSTSPSTVTATLVSGTTQSVSFYTSGLPLDASAPFVPSSCNPTCYPNMVISTSAITPLGVYQVDVCGTNGTISHCYSSYQLTVTKAGGTINPPVVRTVPISENGTVGTNSATIWGELTNMGGASSCLVWFEYRKGTDTIWTKACEKTMTSIGNFSCDITGLTSTTYYFKAFAKNSGSW